MIDMKVIRNALILIILYIIAVIVKRVCFPLNHLSEDQQSNLYRLMSRLDQLCKDHNIPYFIIAGTLLGSIRHKGFIPWDDDIDIGIMSYDLQRLQTVDFSAYGLEAKLSKNDIGKIYFPEHYGNGEKYQSVFVDVFAYEEVEGEKIQFCCDWARDLWPKEYFYKNEIFPLRQYPFGDLMVSGPQQYRPYAKRVWGDWTAYPSRIYQHLFFHPEKWWWLF
jgi:phosphorylcholine metabolism protein LicD